MKALLLLCILFSTNLLAADSGELAIDQYVDSLKLTFFEKQEVKSRAKGALKQVRAEIETGRMDTLAKKHDEGIGYAVERATKILEEHGEGDAAYMYRAIYRIEYKNFYERFEKNERDIGDHKGFVQFIDDLYYKIVSVIGVTAAKALHLSDLFVWNHSNVTFRPCTFPMDAIQIPRKEEYKKHFAEGELYYGTVPVTIYWCVQVPLMMSGVGMLAGPIASAVEFAVAKTVAPKLSDFVFEKACE